MEEMKRFQLVRESGVPSVSKCDPCSVENSRVIDSRLHEHGTIRRRRVCPKCKHHWTSLEVQTPDLDALYKAYDAVDSKLSTILKAFELIFGETQQQGANNGT